MFQRLRMFAVLTKDSSSLAGIFNVALNFLYLTEPTFKFRHLLMASVATVKLWCPYIHGDNTLIHIKYNDKLEKYLKVFGVWRYRLC